MLRTYEISGTISFYFQILQGNTERNVVVTNKLDPPMPSVKFLKIHPKTWESHLALRFELLGCEAMGEIKSYHSFGTTANAIFRSLQ